MTVTPSLPDWSRAYGPPPVRARLRATPDDFLVDEDLGYLPDGDGEHVLLHVRKRNANTEWIARRLRQHAGVRPADIGFAGLKDRFAVTTQWFSVNLGRAEEPDWRALDDEEMQVIAVARHRRKLRRGDLLGNRFTLRLTELSGDCGALERHLGAIAARGVPNYFGEQRFGREAGNLARADALLAGQRERDRHKRGLYISAARSYLFNHVLQARVEADTWDRVIEGDVLVYDGDDAPVMVRVPDADTEKRVAAGRLHPTGPLWGRGRQPVSGAAAAIESRVLEPFASWRDGLEHVGLSAERRSMRLPVRDLVWAFEGEDVLVLRFALDAGSYATAVVREVADV